MSQLLELYHVLNKFGEITRVAPLSETLLPFENFTPLTLQCEEFVSNSGETRNAATPMESDPARISTCITRVWLRLRIQHLRGRQIGRADDGPARRSNPFRGLR